MISLADFKTYLGVLSTDTTQDTALTNIIARATARLETYCNRKLKSVTVEEWQSGEGKSYMYLNNPLITSITKVEELDENYALQDFAVTSDFVSRIQEFKSIIQLKDKTFESGYQNYKITYVCGYKILTGTGTISISISTKAVTGVNTAFDTELAVGDIIQCEGQVFKVATITSATALTVTENASAAISGKSFVISNVPDDLREFALELCKTLFNYSNLKGSEKTLGYSSKAESGNDNVTVQFKDLNWSAIDKYKMITI